jgi:hypothetical protein
MDGGDLRLSTSPNYNVTWPHLTTKLIVKNSGRVGIGNFEGTTLGPVGHLHIHGRNDGTTPWSDGNIIISGEGALNGPQHASLFLSELPDPRTGSWYMAYSGKDHRDPDSRRDFIIGFYDIARQLEGAPVISIDRQTFRVGIGPAGVGGAWPDASPEAELDVTGDVMAHNFYYGP